MEIACSAVGPDSGLWSLCSGVGVVCGLVTVFMVFVVIKSVSSVQIMAKVSFCCCSPFSSMVEQLNE